MLKGLCYDDVAALSHESLKFILLNEKFLQSDWLRAVVFQLNFEISLVVFMPNITTNHAFLYKPVVRLRAALQYCHAMLVF